MSVFASELGDRFLSQNPREFSLFHFASGQPSPSSRAKFLYSFYASLLHLQSFARLDCELFIRQV